MVRRSHLRNKVRTQTRTHDVCHEEHHGRSDPTQVSRCLDSSLPTLPTPD